MNLDQYLDGSSTLELLQQSKDRISRLILKYDEAVSVPLNASVDLHAFKSALSVEEMERLDLITSLHQMTISDPIVDSHDDDVLELEESHDVVLSSCEDEKHKCIMRIERLVQTLKEVKAKAYKNTEEEEKRMRENTGLTRLRDDVAARQKVLEDLKRDLLMKMELIGCRKENPTISDDDLQIKLEEKSEEMVQHYMALVEEKRTAIDRKQREVEEINQELSRVKEEVAQWLSGNGSDDDGDVDDDDEGYGDGLGPESEDWFSRGNTMQSTDQLATGESSWILDGNDMDGSINERDNALAAFGNQALEDVLFSTDEGSLSVGKRHETAEEEINRLQSELDASSLAIQRQMLVNAEIVERFRVTESRVKGVRKQMDQFSKNEDSLALKRLNIAISNYSTEITNAQAALAEVEKHIHFYFNKEKQPIPQDLKEFQEAILSARIARIAYIDKKRELQLAAKLGRPLNEASGGVVESKPKEETVLPELQLPRKSDLKDEPSTDAVNSIEQPPQQNLISYAPGSLPVRMVTAEQAEAFAAVISSLQAMQIESQQNSKVPLSKQLRIFPRPDPTSYEAPFESSSVSPGSIALKATISHKAATPSLGANSLGNELVSSDPIQMSVPGTPSTTTTKSHLKSLTTSKASSRGPQDRGGSTPMAMALPSTPGGGNSAGFDFTYKPLEPLSTVLPSSPRGAPSQPSHFRRPLRLKQAVGKLVAAVEEVTKGSDRPNSTDLSLFVSEENTVGITASSSLALEEEAPASASFPRERIVDKSLVLPQWSRQRLRSIGEADTLALPKDEFLDALASTKRPIETSKLLESFEALNRKYESKESDELFIASITVDDVVAKHAVLQMHELLEAFHGGGEEAKQILPMRKLKSDIKSKMNEIKELFRSIRRCHLKNRSLKSKIDAAIGDRTQICAQFLRAINGRGGLPLTLTSLDEEIATNNEELSSLHHQIEELKQQISYQRNANLRSAQLGDVDASSSLTQSNVSILGDVVKRQRATLLQQKAKVKEVIAVPSHRPIDTTLKEISDCEDEDENEEDVKGDLFPIATVSAERYEAAGDKSVDNNSGSVREITKRSSLSGEMAEPPSEQTIDDIGAQPNLRQTTERIVVGLEREKEIRYNDEKATSVNSGNFTESTMEPNADEEFVSNEELESMRPAFSSQLIATHQEPQTNFLSFAVEEQARSRHATTLERIMETQEMEETPILNRESSMPRQSIAKYSAAFGGSTFFLRPQAETEITWPVQTGSVAPRVSAIKILPANALPSRQKVTVSAPSPIPASLMRPSILASSQGLAAVLAVVKARLRALKKKKARDELPTQRVDLTEVIDEKAAAPVQPRGLKGRQFAPSGHHKRERKRKRLEKQPKKKLPPTTSGSEDDDDDELTTETPSLSDFLVPARPEPIVPVLSTRQQAEDSATLSTQVVGADNELESQKKHVFFEELLSEIFYDEDEIAEELENAIAELEGHGSSLRAYRGAGKSSKLSSMGKRSGRMKPKISIDGRINSSGDETDEVEEEQGAAASQNSWQRTVGVSLQAAKAILSPQLIQSARVLQRGTSKVQ